MGRWLISRTPAALEGRIAARCWDEVVEDMMNVCFLLVGNERWTGKDEVEMQKTELRMNKLNMNQLGRCQYITYNGHYTTCYLTV